MNEQDLIATALEWAKFSTVPGIPKDFTQADATVTEHSITRTEREGGDGEVSLWEEKRWTVLLRGAWAVDLDSTGAPEREPRRVR